MNRPILNLDILIQIACIDVPTWRALLVYVTDFGRCTIDPNSQQYMRTVAAQRYMRVQWHHSSSEHAVVRTLDGWLHDFGDYPAFLSETLEVHAKHGYLCDGSTGRGAVSIAHDTAWRTIHIRGDRVETTVQSRIIPYDNTRVIKYPNNFIPDGGVFSSEEIGALSSAGVRGNESGRLAKLLLDDGGVFQFAQIAMPVDIVFPRTFSPQTVVRQIITRWSCPIAARVNSVWVEETAPSHNHLKWRALVIADQRGLLGPPTTTLKDSK